MTIREEFRQFLRESEESWENSPQSVKDLGEKFGKEVGMFRLEDGVKRWIYISDETFDDLNTGEYIIRYITELMSVSNGHSVLAKINPYLGLCFESISEYDLEFSKEPEKICYIKTNLK